MSEVVLRLMDLNFQHRGQSFIFFYFVSLKLICPFLRVSVFLSWGLQFLKELISVS